MTRHSGQTLRHLAAVALAILSAGAVAGVAALAVSVWAAVAVGVVVGQTLALCLEAWDDRHFPSRVVILETAVK